MAPWQSFLELSKAWTLLGVWPPAPGGQTEDLPASWWNLKLLQQVPWKIACFRAHYQPGEGPIEPQSKSSSSSHTIPNRTGLALLLFCLIDATYNQQNCSADCKWRAAATLSTEHPKDPDKIRRRQAIKHMTSTTLNIWMLFGNINDAV